MPLAPEIEKALILECQKGNMKSFGALYDEYIRRIYNFVYYKTHHKETAEDLTGQTFYKALKNIGQCDPARSFSSWLYRIARNTVIDYYRSKRPLVDIEDVWDLADDRDFISDLDAKLQIEKVKGYLTNLPSPQRDIIIMRVWLEMPYKEIAEIIGKTEENCRVTFSRAVAELREAIPLAAALIALSIKL